MNTPDYIAISNNLGLAAAQLIALTTAFLTALFAVRQVNVVIRSGAYKTVGWFLSFCFVTVFLWILVCFFQIVGWVMPAQPGPLLTVLAGLELFTTVMYMGGLLKAVYDLYYYVSASESEIRK